VSQLYHQLFIAFIILHLNSSVITHQVDFLENMGDFLYGWDEPALMAKKIERWQVIE
jgi:hypothetical protein